MTTYENTKTYFVMTRRGMFGVDAAWPNQCGRPGHVFYHYEIRVAFPGNTKLDQRDFIIAHEDLDATIEAITFVGSCERFQQQIDAALSKLFSAYGLCSFGYRCRIRPTEKSPAFLDFFRVTENSIIPLIA